MRLRVQKKMMRVKGKKRVNRKKKKKKKESFYAKASDVKSVF